MCFVTDTDLKNSDLCSNSSSGKHMFLGNEEVAVLKKNTSWHCKLRCFQHAPKCGLLCLDLKATVSIPGPKKGSVLEMLSYCFKLYQFV